LVYDRVSSIGQPQATFVGFEYLSCHLKGVVKLPGDGVGKKAEVTGGRQYCHVKNLFQRKQANSIAPKIFFATLQKYLSFNYLRLTYFSAVSQTACHPGSFQAVWSTYNTVRCSTVRL